MAGRLIDKIAVVTGGGRGIGEAISRRYARERAEVITVERSIDEAKHLAESIAADGGAATALECDVTDEDSDARMAQDAVSAHSPVDILVNNAGTGTVENVLSRNMESCDTVMDANVGVCVLLNTKHVARQIVTAGGGCVVNVAYQRHRRVFCQRRLQRVEGAVMSITRQTALDRGARGVRINPTATCSGPKVAPQFESRSEK